MPINSYGYSLIEVLISLALISLAFLGFDAMQLLSLQHVRGNYFFTVAVNQLQSMTDRLQVNTDIQSAADHWNAENRAILPQGKGIISGSFPSYTLSIFWGKGSGYTCSNTQLGQSGCLTTKIQLTA